MILKTKVCNIQAALFSLDHRVGKTERLKQHQDIFATILRSTTKDSH